MTEKEFKFDRALNRLEELVERLSTGQLELDEALTLFEEGMKLLVECFKKLEESRAKVEFLIKQSEDAFKRIETSAEMLAERGAQLSRELGLEREEAYDLDEFYDESDGTNMVEGRIKSPKTAKSKKPKLLGE